MTNRKTDLLQGTLDLLVLRVLRSGRLHGYAISKRIQLISREVLSIQQGSLYPALHRLESRGLIESAWDTTETGRRAKFYEITASGRKTLKDETSQWRQFSEAVEQVLLNG